MRAYTLAYAEPFILPAYSSARVYARTYAEEFNLVELSRPALISYPVKCVCLGHAQPTDIDAMVICTRIRAYVHTLILIIHNASARRNIGPRCCPAWRIRACTRIERSEKV